MIYGENVTPLPLKITFLLYILCLGSAMSNTMVFSFLPRLVKYFGATEVNAGNYAGLVGSAPYLSRIFSSLFWGYFLDVKGKKIALLLSASSLAVSTIAFGFSFNFTWTVISRFVQGAFDGIFVIAKAVIVDVCDNTNVSFGLAVVCSSVTLGFIFGPSVGGYLSFIAEQYPQVFSKNELFGKFVILLPNLVVSASLLFPLVFVLIYLPKDEKKIEEHHLIRSGSNIISYGTFAETDNDSKPIEDSSMKKDDPKYSLEVDFVRKTAPPSTGFKASKLYKVVSSKECMLASFLYGMWAFAMLGNTELFPLYTATAVDYQGLGFTVRDIGNALVVAAALVFIPTLTIMPRLNNYFGAKNTLIIAALSASVLCPFLPSLAALRKEKYFSVLLYCHTFCRLFFSMTGFLAVNVLLSNSVTPDLLGSANGFALTIAAVGRMLAPTIFGSIYAWSLTNVKIRANLISHNPLGSPFNQYFAFYLQSLWMILCAVICSQVPETMNYKKVE